VIVARIVHDPARGFTDWASLAYLGGVPGGRAIAPGAPFQGWAGDRYGTAEALAGVRRRAPSVAGVGRVVAPDRHHLSAIAAPNALADRAGGSAGAPV
jgi:hypothetical protein